MHVRAVRLLTAVVTAAALSACVAPGLNPAPKPKPPATTKPKPPTTTKPPALTCPKSTNPPALLRTLTSGTYPAVDIEKGVFRVALNSWVQIYDSPTNAHFGAPDNDFVPGGAPTNAGTWLASVFTTDCKLTVGGTLSYLGHRDAWTGASVDPIAAGYTNGAYLVGLDLLVGTYKLTSPPSGTAKYEIFTDYSQISECSTPAGVASDCTTPSGKVEMAFTGERTFDLTSGDYILHYAGNLTTVA
jgi:hypothetical protein